MKGRETGPLKHTTMETIIKNIHLIQNLSDLDIQKLAYGALQHQKLSRITFKIVSIDETAIKIQTIQGKSPQNNETDEKTLIERTKELFSRFFPDLKVIVNAVVFHPGPVEIVTPAFIRTLMTYLKVKVKDIVKDTDIDKTNVSAWVNGTRDMSQPVKAMFYYYLLSRIDDSKWKDYSELRKSGHYLIKTKYDTIDVVKLYYQFGSDKKLAKLDKTGFGKDYNEHAVVVKYQEIESSAL